MTSVTAYFGINVLLLVLGAVICHFCAKYDTRILEE